MANTDYPAFEVESPFSAEHPSPPTSSELAPGFEVESPFAAPELESGARDEAELYSGPSDPALHWEVFEASARADEEGPKQRRVWSNYMNEQRVTPAAWEEPASLEALRSCLERAAGKQRVRAVGSGHSSSDVARPDETLISLARLNKPLPTASFRPAPGQRLIRVEAGITIADLNRALSQARLALPNMGSFDGQALIGAIATGTHGTGLTLGPLAEFVAAIDLFVVEPDGAGKAKASFRRFEPSPGSTDPQKIGRSADERGLELEVSDDTFYASVVSFGCFGVVYAVTLRVREAFWLEERRFRRPWSKVRMELPQAVREHAYYEVDVFPHANPDLAGDHDCLVVTRREVPAGERARPRPTELRLLRKLADLIGTAPIGDFAAAHPVLIARNFGRRVSEFEAQGPFASASHHVLRYGWGDDIRAWSSEIAVPVEHTVAAVDEILALAKANEARRIRHTAPLALRFVAASRHFLAMQSGRETCTIEVPLLKGTNDHPTILRGIEDALGRKFDGRPHWGQTHYAFGLEQLRRSYPKAEAWLACFKRFNRFRTFTNAFTARTGLDGVLDAAPAPVVRELEFMIQEIEREQEAELGELERQFAVELQIPIEEQAPAGSATCQPPTFTKLKASDVRYLTLEGAGVSALTYIGALGALESLQISKRTGARQSGIRGIAASSSGSLIGLLVASGFASAEISTLTSAIGSLLGQPTIGKRPGVRGQCVTVKPQASATDLAIAVALTKLVELLGGVVTELKGKDAWVPTLVADYGLYDGCALREHIDNAVALARLRIQTPTSAPPVGATFPATLPANIQVLKNCTFAQHKREFGVDLKITVANFDTARSHVLSCGSAPNLPVADGVRMAMAVPPLFKPVILRSDADLKGIIDSSRESTQTTFLKGLWVDGGFFNNMPLDLFGDAARPNTLGLRMHLHQDQPPPVTSFAGFLRRWMFDIGVFGSGESRVSSTYTDLGQTIVLSSSLGVANFNPDPKLVEQIQSAARQQVLSYFTPGAPGSRLGVSPLF